MQGHVPYVVILLQAAETWKKEHDGKMPKTFDEKKKFTEGIKGMAMEYSKQLNFQEAVNNAYKLFQDTELPYNL